MTLKKGAAHLVGRRAIDVCVSCGFPKETHCEFEPMYVPENCVCEVADWGNPSDIPAVCGTFVPMEHDHDCCATCEHLAPCHAGKAAALFGPTDAAG